MKKKVFVGSSSESFSIVDELCKAVNEGKCGERLELVPWVVAFDLSEEILRSLLAIARLDDVLGVYDSLNQALADPSEPGGE